MLEKFDVGKMLSDFEKEESNYLFQKHIAGWNAWQILRRPLYYKIVNDLYLNESEEMGKRPNRFRVLLHKNFSKALNFLKFLKNLYAVSSNSKKKNRFFFFSKEIYKLENDELGRFMNIYIDPLVVQHTGEAVYIDYPDGVSQKEPAFIKEDLKGDGLYFAIGIFRSVLFIFRSFKGSSQHLCDLLNANLHKNKIEYRISRNMVLNIFHSFYAEYLAYNLLFKILKPACCIFTDALGTGMMAAARNNGSRVIELQHGLFGEHKPDYMISGNLKKCKDKMVLPSQIGVFGQFAKNLFLQTGFWDENEIQTIGTYRVDKYRTVKFEGTKPGKFSILFPTQWTAFEESKSLLNFILEFHSDYEIIIKLHPREPVVQKKWYHALSKEYADRCFCHESASIYNLMQKSSICVAFYTTALLEAVALELPAISLGCEIAPQGIFSLIHDPKIEDVIKFALDKKELSQLLNNFRDDIQFRKIWMDNSEEVSKYLYQPNYKTNCEKLLYN